MRQVFFLAVFISISMLVFGCSLEDPKPSTDSLRIAIQESQDVLQKFAKNALGLGFLAGPATTADFNCFAINVTGPGIAPNGAFDASCNSPTNFRNVGPGILSEPAIRGTVFQINVPSGAGRNIDVYGIYPAPPECGGTGNGPGGGGGYFLGRIKKDLVGDSSVVVPVNYGGAPPDVVCTHGPSQSLYLNMIYPYGMSTTSSPLSMTFTGGGFIATSIIKIGNTLCGSLTVTSSTSISCTVPSGIAVGSYYVTVDNQDGNVFTTQTPVFQVVGAATAFVSANVNTNNFDMGSSPVGTPKDILITFVNTGSATATIASTAPTLSGSFSFPGGGLGVSAGATCVAAGTIAAGSSCTAGIRFLPSAAGLTSISGPFSFITTPPMAISQFSGTGI